MAKDNRKAVEPDGAGSDAAPMSMAELVEERQLANDVPSATDLLEKRLPPIACVGDSWHVLKNGVWRPTDRNVYRPVALKALIDEKQTDHYCQQVLNTLESRQQVPKEQLRGFARFDDNDGSILICCQNGVLRVRADQVELLSHDAQYSFTRQAAAAYDPNASYQLFQRVELEALPDEADRDLLAAFGAYTLWPTCELEVVLFCFGATATSKSTLWEFGYGSALGNELVTFLRLSNICTGNGYSIPRLEKAALNLGSEAQAGELSESDAFKQLAEGASMEVRGIYGKPYTMQGYHVKLVFLGNHLPRFKSGTDAELRRCRFLHFMHSPAQKDPTLKTRIAAERDGTFSNVMVPALQWLLANRRMPMGGKESQRIMRRFALQNDPIKAFGEECCDLDLELDASKEKLHRAFYAFCERNDLSAGLRERDVFFMKLRASYPSLTDYRARGSSGREYRLRGIAVKEGVPCPPLRDTDYLDENYLDEK